MPLGLTNAFMAFMDFMNRVKSYLGEFEVQFINGIVRYSTTKKDYIIDLRQCHQSQGTSNPKGAPNQRNLSYGLKK